MLPFMIIELGFTPYRQYFGYVTAISMINVTVKRHSYE